MAAEQHGVVSTRQLVALGYAKSTVADWAKAGRLHRVHRGVYAVGHTDLAWEGRCMAAVLACAPAVASHWTAAWLLGLARYRPSGFDLTVPSRRGHRRQEFFVHYAPLTAEDVTEVDGIPATSLERTHLDIAARWPDALPTMLEAAEGSKRLDLRRFESLLARTSRHPGYGPLQQALRVYRPDPTVIRSNLERDFRALLRTSSLPLPSHNFIVGPYELDCYWPEHRFCVELDTYATHGSRRSFEQDRKRERELRRLGVEVERVTDLQLEHEPDEVLAAVAESLRRRAPVRASRAPTAR
ncbi:MAG TPA: type IV toxin-antitoxin system AbiEi family antitoxin domain-containing protein [Solirubrobacterales bacterium]